MLTEDRGVVMLEVGLSAMRAMMSWPVEIPPSTPPALLLLNSPKAVISSLCSVPRWVAAPRPAPTSTALTALMLIKALAMSASSRSNTGSPRPAGTPRASTWTTAPHESPSLRSWAM